MICDRILGNLFRDPPGRWKAVAKDEVRLAWHHCFRRALKRRSVGGRSIGLLMPLGTTLVHGDVIHGDDAILISISVEPCEVLSVSPLGVVEMGLVAAELGNLHIPMEIRDDGGLLVLPDGPAEEVLRRYSANYLRDTCRFLPLRASVPDELRLADTFQVVRHSDDRDRNARSASASVAPPSLSA